MFVSISTFVVPAAQIHLAELVYNYTVCREPVKVRDRV
jgi:hypothetical protein